MGFKLLLESIIYKCTQARIQDFNLGESRPEGPRTEMRFLRRGSHTLPPARGLGERCKLSVSNRGRPNGFTILSTQDAVS